MDTDLTSTISSRRFAQHNTLNWTPTPEYNLLFLQCQQNYMNERLRSEGFLLLNDVYQALGLSRTSEGCIIGWICSEESHIDFGIRDQKDSEGSFTLHFNVDGIIYDQIEKKV